MDDRARGAADLLAAMHRAGKAFRDYGYARFLAHQSVSWRYLSGIGQAVEPFATVGVSFQLHDEIDRDRGRRADDGRAVRARFRA
ncbi:hypothetical protein ACFQFC_10875 [Amorphoplanes digitatis]|uniref:Uncharacterized protein n=1 Tax=Actinoplanes digitatis TaxID=1868 RepID=A0A7W7I1V2_9ACTN|nr:hypothetical protein [Actinoplanes digitatis]MBB4764701.1 hypothetical protein [Actinoplanes digitatis]